MKPEQPALITRITPAITQTYLQNVAEALNNTIIPGLEGATRARATDCLRIVSRLISDSQLSEATLEILRNGTSGAKLDALVEGRAIENANREGEDYLHGLKTKPPTAVRTFDHAPLQAYLREHALGGPDTIITQSRLLPGGRSKVTILVSQQGARSLPEEFVVRQDWANSLTGKAVASEYALLLRLFREGVRVPEPLLLEKSDAFLGKPFLVFPRRPGAPVGDHFMVLPPTEGPLMQLAEQIGRVHAIPASEFEHMEGVAENNYTAEQLRGSLSAYAQTIASLDSGKSVLVEAAIEWLHRNAERVAVLPRALVHGDLGFHNLLVDGDELCAILDWEMTHIGNPACDLGYIRHAVTDEALWDRFMAHYRAAGGPAIAPEFIDYFTLFTGVWYHQIQLQARNALCLGVVRDIEISALCADFAPQVLGSISRTLHRVSARQA